MDFRRIADILASRGTDQDRRRTEDVRRGFWRTVRAAGRTIPFMDEVVAAYFCALDDRTPMRVRATLLAALAYFVLPLDTIPDFLLGMGFTDDVAVLTAAFAAIRQHITPAHRLAARRALEERAKA
jgi:uncharacterized membrane protein YkvA (DUF1232 family)